MVHEEGDMLVHYKKRMRKEKRKEKRAASWDKKRKRESKNNPQEGKSYDTVLNILRHLSSPASCGCGRALALFSVVQGHLIRRLDTWCDGGQFFPSLSLMHRCNNLERHFYGAVV